MDFYLLLIHTACKKNNRTAFRRKGTNYYCNGKEGLPQDYAFLFLFKTIPTKKHCYPHIFN